MIHKSNNSHINQLGGGLFGSSTTYKSTIAPNGFIQKVPILRRLSSSGHGASTKLKTMKNGIRLVSKNPDGTKQVSKVLGDTSKFKDMIKATKKGSKDARIFAKQKMSIEMAKLKSNISKGQSLGSDLSLKNTIKYGKKRITLNPFKKNRSVVQHTTFSSTTGNPPVILTNTKKINGIKSVSKYTYTGDKLNKINTKFSNTRSFLGRRGVGSRSIQQKFNNRGRIVKTRASQGMFRSPKRTYIGYNGNSKDPSIMTIRSGRVFKNEANITKYASNNETQLFIKKHGMSPDTQLFSPDTLHKTSSNQLIKKYGINKSKMTQLLPNNPNKTHMSVSSVV